MVTIQRELSSEELQNSAQLIKRILDLMAQKIVGQDLLRRRLLTALITDGHILLEGVPGLAKTLSIQVLAQVIDASFKRIQFTPDLLPSDLIGTEVYRPEENRFVVRQGPIFANFILADEINRAPAKVQSALLEAMQERQVTIGQETFKLPDPFFVMATQNPLEHEGTYPLPEAQIDRFIMKVKVDYPSVSEEKEILALAMSGELSSRSASGQSSLKDVSLLKKTSERIYIDERVREYIVNIVWASRKPEDFRIKTGKLIELGASPRASIALLLASRAEALLNGSPYVTPQHVKNIAYDVLRHRVVPTYEAEAQGLDADALIKLILDGVQVP